MTTAYIWNISDDELEQELSRFSYWAGVIDDEGNHKPYPGADNLHEAIGYIAEAMRRLLVPNNSLCPKVNPDEKDN